MSQQISYLHSHSELEKMLVYPKSHVIVDAKFKNLFGDGYVETFTYKGKKYCKVPTLLFVQKNGVFKRFME